MLNYSCKRDPNEDAAEVIARITTSHFRRGHHRRGESGRVERLAPLKLQARPAEQSLLPELLGEGLLSSTVEDTYSIGAAALKRVPMTAWHRPTLKNWARGDQALILLLSCLPTAFVSACADNNEPRSQRTQRDELLPLTDLVRTGNIEQIRSALEGGASVDQRDDNRNTPLIVAAWHNQPTQVLGLLLDFGAAVDARDQFGNTALMGAAASSISGESVQLLIDEGADVNAANDFLQTALMFAAQSNRSLATLQILVRAGAQLEARTELGWTPLIVAAANSTPEFVEALIAAGADIEASAPEPELYTPLTAAAAFNSPDVVRVLLGAGANPNTTNARGLTPLMFSAYHSKHPEVIELLLQSGANARARDAKGRSSFDYALDNSVMRQSPVIELLKSVAR